MCMCSCLCASVSRPTTLAWGMVRTAPPRRNNIQNGLLRNRVCVSCVYLTVSPGHRCCRGIPAQDPLINVRVTGREVVWRLDGEVRAGAQGEEAEGVTRGDASLILCLSLPLPWWNVESHERGPISLSLSLRLVSCVCLKSATVLDSTHYLSADFPSAPHTRGNKQTQVCAHRHIHTYRCALHTVYSVRVKFLSKQEK